MENIFWEEACSNQVGIVIITKRLSVTDCNFAGTHNLIAWNFGVKGCGQLGTPLYIRATDTITQQYEADREIPGGQIYKRPDTSPL